MTIYASYKQGYKGPGFNNQTFLLASYNPAIVPNAVGGFSGEEVEGVEGGIKAQLLDGRLDLSFTPYYYEYDKLQVSNLNYVTNVIEVQNGADARTQGFELTAAWSPEGHRGMRAQCTGGLQRRGVHELPGLSLLRRPDRG